MPETTPRISVILPTRNRATLVGRAIDSVLAQTCRDFELIVIDDASTDNTVAVLGAIGDPRLVVRRLTSAGGAAAARNHGLSVARGEFVGFQDSDDTWRPEKLERQLTALETAGATAVASVCSFRHIFPNRTRDIIHSPGVVPGPEVARRIVYGLSLGTVSLMARRRAVNEAGGFDETLPRLQDIELCLRLSEKGAFVFLDAVLQDIYFTSDSISADAARFHEALDAIASRHRDLFERHPRGHAWQLYRAGKYHAFDGNTGAATSLLAASLRRNPANWRTLVMLAATVLHLAPLLGRRGNRTGEGAR
jgi:glycosyltransferase involved in cell wall biosynthesis